MNVSSIDITPEKIYTALKDCYDPEIPVNIIDLGLVYDVQIKEGGSVFVKMTLTTPGCGMGESICRDAKTKILGIDGVEEVEVEIVWNPPWNQNMISEEGRKKLGMT